MGCQISAGKHEICYSVGSWLVIEMCSPWYVEERDSDGEHQQTSIHESSVVAADQEIPKHYTDYLKWRTERNFQPLESMSRPFDAEDFTTARDFIREVALTPSDIWVSY